MKVPKRFSDWFRSKTGRVPDGFEEVESLLLREFYANNLRPGARRKLIVDYAINQGGVVEQYFRRKMPWLFFDSSTNPSEAASSLGLSPEEEQEIWGKMLDEVWAKWKESPEFRLEKGPETLVHPDLGSPSSEEGDSE